MREHLQNWYDGWLDEHRATDLIYAQGGRGPSLGQVLFVRDILAGLFFKDLSYEEREKYERPHPDGYTTPTLVSAYVVGEHRSKSVRLPVYHLEREDIGLHISLRDNFHDWNVTVSSYHPISKETMRGFPDRFDERDRERFPNEYEIGSGKSWGYCFFQGFPESAKRGPWNEHNRNFSLWVNNDYELFAFLMTLRGDLAKHFPTLW